MATIRVLRRGVRQLLQGAEGIGADLERRAINVARQAGPGHEVEMFVGRNRIRATISTETFEAMRAEQKDRNLTRAIDAARR